jgi:hypothetical protein
MAVSLSKNFRRLLAQTLAADEDEIRALIERMLPPGEGGKRVLRLESDDDRQLARLAIVAALSVDAITGDEVEELRRQANNVLNPTAPPRPWWEDPRFARLNPEERRQSGYVRPLEEDPLAESIRAWGKATDHDCDATKTGAAIVNNNENTMAENSDLSQITAGQKPSLL